MFGKDVPPEVRQSVLSALAATPDRVIESTMNGLADSSIWKEDTIKVPVEMILCANRYSPWPPDYEQQVRKLAPELEFHKIEGTGHFLIMERPKEFNAVLAGFLKKQGVIAP
jgi:pimeloyl-ACP methyl ester carboxylesterase